MDGGYTMNLKTIRQMKRNVSDLLARMKKKPPRMKFLYASYVRHLPIKKNRVLFESFHGKDISDSPLAILQELLKEEDSNKYDIWFATLDPKKHKEYIDSLGLNIHLIDVSSYDYPKILATSEYLVNNSSFPAYFIRREGQKYIQTWHGTPLKTLGKKMRMGIESMYNVQHNFIQADTIMFPNDFTKEVMMEDYNLNTLFTGKVVMNGYPRNSVFLDKDRAIEVKNKLGNDDYTTFAYMPTWRGQSNYDVDITKYSKTVTKMLTELDEKLKDHQKLYVNFHPMVARFMSIEGYKHIEPFPMGVDKYEFLNSVDCLITDYSSVFFDYSVTRKPIILYIYDYDQYMYDRGMYFDIKELPFIKVYELDELTELMVNETFRGYSYADNTDYINRYIQYDSIDAANKIKNLVFHNDESDLKIHDYSANKETPYRVIAVPDLNTPRDLDTIASMATQKNDIVVFEKRCFNPTMSSYFYDHYVNNFDFIFITKTTPRTYFEEVVRRFSKKIRSRLHKRELERVFGDLNISEYVTEMYVGEQDSSYWYERHESVLDADVSLEGNTYIIDLSKNKDKTFTKILLTVDKNTIVWTRDLTDEEKDSYKVVEDFRAPFDAYLMKRHRKYYIGIEEVTDTGKKMHYFTNKEKLSHKKEVSFYDRSELVYMPIYLKDTFFDNRILMDEIGVLCTLDNEDGYMQIQSDEGSRICDKFIKVHLSSTSGKGTVYKIKAKLRKKSFKLNDVVLRYRSVIEDIEYPFTYTIEESDHHYYVTATIDFSAIDLKELYWDIIIKAEINGRDIDLYPYYSLFDRAKLRFTNEQYFVGDDHVIFPYRSKAGKLAFTYRQSSPYDAYKYRLKEFAAYAVFMLGHPYWSRKEMWIVYEKFCSMAQDNGYYFFKFTQEQLPEKECKKIFFVLDKNSVDWDKMSVYGKQVIPFMSFRHMLYVMVSKIYVASDSKTHLYQWRPKPSIIADKIRVHKILFLQHGVTALKRVDGIFGKRGTSPMTYFTTTSTYEQKIVCENFGYLPEEAPILGFTRWDVLEDKSDPKEKIILAMPTWRSWLEEKSAEEFRSSDYYQNYMKFLSSEKLKALLEENNVKLIFYIHPKFKDYLSEFNISGDHIELIPFGSTPLNEIMMKCSMLITDYSSVCWDVYYMEKPVLFYQFDYDMYMTAHGSYMDMEKDLFGERYMECDDVINGIEEYINRDFKLKPEYQDKVDYYFTYRDNNNSRRTYNFVCKTVFERDPE